MLKIKSTKKYATILPGIKPNNNPQEDRIFGFVREAIKTMPQQPIVRCVGGWIRDKLLPLLRPELNIPPPDDLDLTVTNMTGAEFVIYCWG